MPRYLRVVTSSLIGLVLAAVLPVIVDAAAPTTPSGPLRSAAPARLAKPPTSVYLVQLKAAPAASYQGGVPGYAATRPNPGRKLDRSAGAVDSYAGYLERLHDELLAEIGAHGAKIYSFRYALNGFAASLTAAQAATLAQHELVERVWLDSDRKIQTNNSSAFLGLLDAKGGLRADLKLTGEDVIVGIIDSGIAPNHPSLRDAEDQIPRACRSQWARSSWLGRWLCRSVRRHPPTAATYGPVTGFSGICEIGEGFTVDDCNNKVIGARYYIDGFLQRHTLDDGEFVSPKDVDGHGTHIATIVAGNSVSATLFGVRVARISGIAPRARIAVYKACWVRPGDVRATCTTADLARAIDDAVADGVDIINYSVGSLETDLTAPDDLALLNALDAGVLSTVAAGNDGPELGTIGSPSSAPWVLTVGASTQSGTSFAEAIEIIAPADLAGRVLMQEANFTRSLTASGPIEAELALADDDQNVLSNGSLGSERDACEPLVNAAETAGRIALIERGNCDFELKLKHAEQAGAAAVVVYNNNGLPIVMNGSPGSVAIPGVMIGTADGQRVLNRLTADDVVTVRLEKGLFLETSSIGNQIADFSSRGPALSEGDFLKPDVTAPGVDILAGHTSDVANGLRGQQFQYLSGTSMSAPEAAGVAALLKQANPDWSPGVLKSALMTTARQNIVEEDLETAAHPFEIGAGHIDPDRAIAPGLVYEAGYLDFAAYLCGLDDPPFVASDCDILSQAGYSFAPRDVNLPSLGVTELISGDVVTRRVTNLGPPATYAAAVSPPFGMQVFIDPPTLSLGTGESREFDVRFEATTPDLDLWSFGELVWSSETRTVRSPMAVKPVTLRAPTELELLGTEGSGTYDVAFGYSGGYDSSVHGLNPPFLLVDDGFVEDDPANSFSFRQGSGVAQHWFTVAPDDFYLRVALFDELTDGTDDLDLYLYFCPETGNCIQIAESGSFTSEEQIDIPYPFPGQYTVLVHGYETDQTTGGPGAHYSLFAWSLSENDPGGNLEITIPTTVEIGDRYDLDVSWGPLDAETRYFGGILHFTTNSIEPYSITLVTARAP